MTLPIIKDSHCYPVGKFKNILAGYVGPDLVKLQEIQRFLKENLGKSRYDHSILTLEKAIELAEGEKSIGKDDVSRIYMAALSHDITKEMPAHFHHEILKRNHIKDISKIPTTLYHSWTAPLFLKEEFEISDDLVLHAVRYHSTGCSEMPLVSKIVFAADFLASSYNLKNNEKITDTLDEICIAKLLSTIEYLLEKKMPVQCDSINFYNTLVWNSKNEKSN